ncbi:MAG: zinc protease [Gammaproteobacteria bacterium RBG_16_57_12]|nr:MAG: zinc protease [Gammaproteobacteria bacterium RBG_16_57_12]
MYVKSIIILWALVAGAAQAAPKIEHWVAANGARVYFVAAPELPIVDIQVAFDAGSARDGNFPGLATLTNLLLDDGAAGLNADQIAEGLEGVGASMGASSSRDMATVSLRSLTDPAQLKPAIEIFKGVLSQPSFPKDAFERERKQLLVGVSARKQSPEEIADELFYQGLYGEHPYAHHPDGSDDSLKSLTAENVLMHFQAYYVGKNAVIAIVGALDRAAAADLVGQLTEGMPAGLPAPSLPEVAGLAEGKLVRQNHPSTQTHILLGQPGLSRGDPDYFPLYVGNHMLGGSGLVSRINEEIREKRGLSYSAYSYFMPMRLPGPYILGLQTRNESSDEALGVLKQTLGDFIAKGPTAEELKASKQNITGGFPLRLSSNRKILDHIAMIGFYQLPLDYLDTFNARVEAVTIEQIRAAFQQRIHPDKMVTVMVGNHGQK